MPLDKKYGLSIIPNFIDIALMRRKEEILHWHKRMVDMAGTSVVGKSLDKALDDLCDFEEDDKSDDRQVDNGK